MSKTRSVRGVSAKNWIWLRVTAVQKRTTVGDLLNQIIDPLRTKDKINVKPARKAATLDDYDPNEYYESDGMLYRRRD
jgi:hypothetical protein